ncbi:hypothetical protein [Ktedonobacter racemifer]|uniref:Uncharacterized protein n=1 Tax=Ktedonobacter racemifer DSM 44963 TaxID=485913 RepID=D6TQ68_KTERA|nr:hypothetical protein [Ktedonobacter racemifer]EFH85716.1 hypothetical protein Krac_6946 [Ktedonobacter racemifer DSM 44963]
MAELMADMADRWRIDGGSMADKLSPDSCLFWLTSTVVLAGNRLDGTLET